MHAAPRSRPLRRRGFSIVEVMIAVTILAVAGLAILSLTVLNRRFTEQAVYQSTAMTAAQGYLEQMKSMDFGSIFQNPIPCRVPTDAGTTADDLVTPSATPANLTISTWNPSTWTWNFRPLDMQQTANVSDDLSFWFAVHAVPTNAAGAIVAANAATSATIILHFYYESRTFGGRRNSPIYTLRLVRSQVPTVP